MVDTANRYFVSARGDGIFILRQPIGVMTRTEALSLAAHLVAIADMSENNEDFARILKAVQGV
jgi:hypothetical protein